MHNCCQQDKVDYPTNVNKADQHSCPKVIIVKKKKRNKTKQNIGARKVSVSFENLNKNCRTRNRIKRKIKTNVQLKEKKPHTYAKLQQQTHAMHE